MWFLIEGIHVLHFIPPSCVRSMAAKVVNTLLILSCNLALNMWWTSNATV
ncbi:hypothetical protein RND71_003141 [Anisodus tanguticus]|uniref:Uncharacterized protein n=1 Tax=Anisodus tanguticus TaxID=243964 RepID=A0AAE1SVD8_9SOLA|nr:hypothetical protein RND71_003141 [Anisodus tanguticus]